MALDLSKMTLTMAEDPLSPPPPQTPVSILDMERTGEVYDMFLPMQDPCPVCGAFRMLVGDWACWGVCYVCASEGGSTK